MIRPLDTCRSAEPAGRATPSGKVAPRDEFPYSYRPSARASAVRSNTAATVPFARSLWVPAGAARGRFLGAWLQLHLAVAVAWPGTALAEEPVRIPQGATESRPYELVRSLQKLQDRVVHGDAGAKDKVASLVAHIGARMLAADSHAWDDPRNLRAAIVYGLSGGQARVVREIAKSVTAGNPEKDLLDGTLAYLERRQSEARRLLLPIDARSLAPPLAGHVAMVQAGLIETEDPREALRLLARARILAAGTLVEEAALRKAVFLADEAGDIEAFADLSSQYIRRFEASAYAENFHRRFKAAVTRFGLSADPNKLATLERLLDTLAPDERLPLYLAWARAGIVQGMIGPARRAVEKASALAREGTAEAARSALYDGVTLVLTSEIDAGLAKLGSLETAKLVPQDADLRNAAVALATEMRIDPFEQRPTIEAEPEATRSARSGDRHRDAAASASVLIRRAEAALTETGALLARQGF